MLCFENNFSKMLLSYSWESKYFHLLVACSTWLNRVTMVVNSNSINSWNMLRKHQTGINQLLSGVIYNFNHINSKTV